MALKFVVLALAITTVSCAPGARQSGNDLTRANVDELRDRVDACTKGVPGQSPIGSFDTTGVDDCIGDAITFVRRRRNADPSKVITSLPECFRSVGVKESDIQPVTQCLQTNIPLPWTYIEGNKYYTLVDAVWHQFALQDCIDGNVDPDSICTNLAYSNFARGAEVDAVATNLSECLVRIRADEDEATQALQCFSSEAHDPAVEARAKEYLQY